jgi:hypothetical protein
MTHFIDHDDREVVRSTSGKGEEFGSIVSRRMSRRTFLKGSVAASTVVVGAAAAGAQPKAAQAQSADLGFSAIQGQPADVDSIMVPEGYESAVLLRWGDPIIEGAPEFDVENQTAEAQSQQFGYNCDYVGFLPLPVGSEASDRGLLGVNHEYTNPDIMFPGYDPEVPNPTKEQVDVELAAHGVTVIEIARDADGNWTPNLASQYNRRYTAMSPMQISGPAAGHEWLQTTEDPSGGDIRGTLNNCAGGKTPWGTIVTAEENFHQYFANTLLMDEADPRRVVHARYGLPEESSSRRWEEFYNRFDVSMEPNEPFRFGWAVEYDPYNPDFVPVKRTSIGRYRHEAQTFAVAPSGQVAVYSGDDARFEYIYKFVTEGTFDPNNREANLGILDTGTLYVARFNEDGSGEWIPLIYGEGPLTEENGFTSQGDVLIKTRLAADLLGATKMDRPEDIQPNPVNQKVYIVLTKNAQRGVEENPDTNAANPRAANTDGHIIELTEDGDDHASTTFSWEIFMLCGDPADESTYFAGFPKDQVSPTATPDNITFDNAGNLWISTDGQPSALEINDGLFAVPVSGENRGYVRQFFSAVAESEVCGPEFTPDNTTLFLAIQHPGEGGTFAEPISTWPDGEVPPRPSVITVRATSGGPVGTVGAQGEAQAQEGELPDSSGDFGPAPWLAAAGIAAALGGAYMRRRSQIQGEQDTQNNGGASS